MHFDAFLLESKTVSGLNSTYSRMSLSSRTSYRRSHKPSRRKQQLGWRRSLLGLIAVSLPSVASARDLTLDQAVRLAVENNFDLRVEALNPQIAMDQLGIARASFDPSFYSNVEYEDTARRQNVMQFVSTGENPNLLRWDQQSLRVESGIGGSTPWGMQYRFGVNVDIYDNSTNRQAPTLNEPLGPGGSFGPLYSPEYETFAGVTLTQPLLRGGGTESALAETRIALLEASASELVRRIAITNKLVEVVNAFYDLSFGEENLTVKAEAIELAEQFLAEAKRKLDVGRSSEIDVARAEVKKSEAQEEYILAKDFRRDRQIALMRLIVPGWDANSQYEDYRALAAFHPVIAPTNLQKETEDGLSLRPDVRLAELRRDQEDVRHVYARNRSLPTLDLQMRYGLNGYGGTVEDSFDTAREGGEPTWAVGVVFSVPLGNREGRSEMRMAKRRAQQAQLEIEKVRTDVSLQILNAVRRIETFQQRLETAIKSRELAEKALEAENRRFENGLSASIDVLDLQTQLSSARTRELAAQVDLAKAEAELWLANGEMLEQLGLAVRDVGDPSEADFHLLP